ncbi:MAG TPA: YggS family pyridoxal phosphate-dependent enzyme, partial [Clostridiales bacterium]|nr:YggS family pyridoxal phosphate-dependent enzyme [Clostridiales bacterium]
SPEEIFYKMQKLYIDISEENIDNIDMKILSMGMSKDYQIAIKYGANMIRVGSALFGARIY